MRFPIPIKHAWLNCLYLQQQYLLSVVSYCSFSILVVRYNNNNHTFPISQNCKTSQTEREREKRKSVSKMVPKFNGGVDDDGGTGRGTKPI